MGGDFSPELPFNSPQLELHKAHVLPPPPQTALCDDMGEGKEAISPSTSKIERRAWEPGNRIRAAETSWGPGFKGRWDISAACMTLCGHSWFSVELAGELLKCARSLLKSNLII